LVAALASGLDGALARAAAAAGVEADAVDAYVDDFLATLKRAVETNAATIARSAAEAAAEIPKGGKLCISDELRSIVSESSGQASGPMMTKYGRKPRDSRGEPWRDTILLFNETRDFPTNVKLAEDAKAKGAISVGFEVGTPPDGRFGPFIAACTYGIYTGGEAGAVDVKGANARVSPTTGVMNVAMLWIWLVELAGRMAEAGHPPAMWVAFAQRKGAEINPGQKELLEKRGY
jgi:hypothetical protein